jgi:hypothetical protein
VVSVLKIESKVRGLNPEEGDRFLRAIKIRSTTSFAGEVRFSGVLKMFRSMKVIPVS